MEMPMTEIPEEVKDSLNLVEDLKFFLATAPANWQENQVIRRYYLNNDEGFISCVFWNNLYFVTGTDIVRCILYKFQHFGRTVTDRKKFEEGIFSDLRSLKAGSDAVLESPKSEFLEFLYKNQCIRTQKKQKVFFWFNVPHDKLMADALERDIKREKAGQTPTSIASREPALSFNYVEDKSKTLYEQLSVHLAQSKFDVANLDATPVKELESASNDLYTSYTGQQPEDKATEPNFGGLGEGSNKNLDNLDNLDNLKEEDDDFPLDFVDQLLDGTDEWARRDYAGRDYITLDPPSGAPYTRPYDYRSYDSRPYDSRPFESRAPYIEASELDQWGGPSFLGSVNVATTDDYLIEQTVPGRTYPGNLTAQFSPSSSFFYPRSAKVYDEQQYTYPPPALPSAMMAVGGFSYEPHGGYHFPVVDPAAPVYSHMPYDHDFFHSQITPVVHHADQFGGYPDDFMPSQRQQEASNSMMRKRKQLGKVGKPAHRTGSKVRSQANKEETKFIEAVQTQIDKHQQNQNENENENQ